MLNVVGNRHLIFLRNGIMFWMWKITLLQDTSYRFYMTCIRNLSAFHRAVHLWRDHSQFKD